MLLLFLPAVALGQDRELTLLGQPGTLGQHAAVPCVPQAGQRTAGNHPFDLGPGLTGHFREALRRRTRRTQGDVHVAEPPGHDGSVVTYAHVIWV